MYSDQLLFFCEIELKLFLPRLKIINVSNSDLHTIARHCFQANQFAMVSSVINATKDDIDTLNIAAS